MTRGSDGISLGRVTTQLLLSRAVGYLLALGNSVILARVLGAERLGEYTYAMGIAALFGLLPHLGISTVVTRTIARDPDAGAGVVGAALRAQALLATGVLLGIPAFALILPEQPVPLGYVILAAAQLALGTLSWPYLAVLGGRARYDRLAMAELVTGLVATLTLLAVALLHGSVAAFLWAQVLAAGIAVIVARLAATSFVQTGGTEPMRIGALLRHAAPFGATTAVQSLYTRLDILLLGQLASTAALGLYNVAYKPTNLAVNFGSTVAGTLFPVMAQAREPGAPVAFQRALRGLSTAGPAMALTFSGLATPLLHTLYGSEFTAAALVLSPLAWSAAANWLYAPLAVALQARGQERWWMISLAGGLALNAAGNIWAIPRWGALGAAGATLGSEIALLALGTVLVGRKLGILPSLRPVLVSLGATACGAATLWTLGTLGALWATLAALAVYVGLLMLFRVVTAEDAAIVSSWVRQAICGWSHG